MIYGPTGVADVYDFSEYLELLPSKKSISRSQEEFPTDVQGSTKEICRKLTLK
jgi:hypothetical protein